MTVTEGSSLPPEMLLLTERYAVYRCYSDQGGLLYIGSTGSLGRRFGAHMEKAWFLQVRGITLEWYADELSARNAEHRAIHIEHPKYNIQSRSKPTARRKSAKGRADAPSRPPANGPVTEAQARTILAAEPGISGGELGRRLGKTTRYGCMLKAKLTSPVGADFPESVHTTLTDAEAAALKLWMADRTIPGSKLGPMVGRTDSWGRGAVRKFRQTAPEGHPQKRPREAS